MDGFILYIAIVTLVWIWWESDWEWPWWPVA
jgi:hypothetical protein